MILHSHMMLSKLGQEQTKISKLRLYTRVLMHGEELLSSKTSYVKLQTPNMLLIYTFRFLTFLHLGNTLKKEPNKKCQLFTTYSSPLIPIKMDLPRYKKLRISKKEEDRHGVKMIKHFLTGLIKTEMVNSLGQNIASMAKEANST